MWHGIGGAASIAGLGEGGGAGKASSSEVSPSGESILIAGRGSSESILRTGFMFGCSSTGSRGGEGMGE